jgi:signal transduction histidine kinase
MVNNGIEYGLMAAYAEGFGGLCRAGKEGHYRVKGMRERALRIGARLSIVSDAARGTEVCLIVPGRIAFREASDGKVRGGHDPASADSE